MYLGYAAEPFPGVSQALDDGDVDAAQAQVAVAATCVTDAAQYLVGEM